MNTFPSLVLTARHIREVGNTRSSLLAKTNGKIGNQNEVVSVNYTLRLSISNIREKTWLYAGIAVYLRLLML